MKKSIIFLSLICILIMTLAFPASANSPLFFDGAALVDGEEASAIADLLADISDKHETDVVIYTVYDTDGYSDVEETAENIYFEENYSIDCLMLYVAIGIDECCIYPAGFGEIAANNDGIEYILNKLRSDMSNGNFYDAFYNYALLCDDFLTRASSAEGPYTAETLPEEPFDIFDLFTIIFVSLIVGAIIGLIVVLILKGQLKSVKRELRAENYIRPESLNITNSQDIFLYKTLSRRPRPKQSSSGSSSGGSGSRSMKF